MNLFKRYLILFFTQVGFALNFVFLEARRSRESEGAKSAY